MNPRFVILYSPVLLQLLINEVLWALYVIDPIFYWWKSDSLLSARCPHRLEQIIGDPVVRHPVTSLLLGDSFTKKRIVQSGQEQTPL